MPLPRKEFDAMYTLTPPNPKSTLSLNLLDSIFPSSTSSLSSRQEELRAKDYAKKKSALDFCEEHILETLANGVIMLAKALECDVHNYDVNPPLHTRTRTRRGESKSGYEEEDDDDDDDEGLEIRVFLALNLNAVLGRGVEFVFNKFTEFYHNKEESKHEESKEDSKHNEENEERKSYGNGINTGTDEYDIFDNLATYLFEHTPPNQDQDDDERVQPLVYLAQYFMRHNPLHSSSSMSMSASSTSSMIKKRANKININDQDQKLKQKHEFNKILTEPSPNIITSIITITSPTSNNSNKAGALLLGGLPFIQKGLISNDLSEEIICCVHKRDGDGDGVKINCIRVISSGDLVFRVVDSNADDNGNSADEDDDGDSASDTDDDDNHILQKPKIKNRNERVITHDVVLSLLNDANAKANANIDDNAHEGQITITIEGLCQNLLSSISLVSKGKGEEKDKEIEFAGYPKLVHAQTTQSGTNQNQNRVLVKCTKKIEGRVYIVDVFLEDALFSFSANKKKEKDRRFINEEKKNSYLYSDFEGEESKDGIDGDGEVKLIRFRIYDPEASRYYETSIHLNLPPSSPTEQQQQQPLSSPRQQNERERERTDTIMNALENIIITESYSDGDERTGGVRAMKFGFTSKFEEECGARRDRNKNYNSDSVSKSVDVDLNVEVGFDDGGNGNGTATATTPTTRSPRLQAALNASRSLDPYSYSGPNVQVNVNAKQFQLMSLKDSGNFNKNAINKTKDKTPPNILQAKQTAHKNAKKEHKLKVEKGLISGSKRKVDNKDETNGNGNGMPSIKITKHCIKLSSKFLIVTTHLLSTSSNGTLQFSAYDPSSCITYSCYKINFDTRGLCVEVEGEMWSSGSVQGGRVFGLIKCLRLVRKHPRSSDNQRDDESKHKDNDSEEEDELMLVLHEKTQTLTHLRTSFEKLPQDFLGRVQKSSALHLIISCKTTMRNTMPSATHAELVEEMNLYLESVYSNVSVYGWPWISFKEFCVLLEVGEDSVGGVSPRSPRV